MVTGGGSLKARPLLGRETEMAGQETLYDTIHAAGDALEGAKDVMKQAGVAIDQLKQQNAELLKTLKEITDVASLDAPVTLAAAAKRLAHIENEGREAVGKAKEGTDAS